MKHRFRPVAAAAVSVALVACAEATTAGGGPERAAYLTLFGDDTLAVEWMEFGPNSVDARALIRGSRTTWNEYHLGRGPSGEITAWEARSWAGGSDQGELLSSEMLEQTDSGPVLVTMRGGEESRRPFEAGACSVPFVDMLHWTFEAGMRCQVEQGALGDAVEVFSGRGSTFPWHRTPMGAGR